jgi:hypothetical protein
MAYWTQEIYDVSTMHGDEWAGSKEKGHEGKGKGTSFIVVAMRPALERRLAEVPACFDSV